MGKAGETGVRTWKMNRMKKSRNRTATESDIYRLGIWMLVALLAASAVTITGTVAILYLVAHMVGY